MYEWLWIGLVFACISVLAFAVIQLIGLQSQRLRDRVKHNDDDTIADSDSNMVLGGLTPVLAQQIPVREEDKARLQPELKQAGYYAPTAVMEYAAVRAVLIVAPLFLAFIVALFVDRTRVPIVLVGGGILSVLGFSVPRLYINYRAAVRKRQIERGLPVAVDLLTLGLTGGQNILMALGRVAREMRTSYPLLASELEIVRMQAQYANLPQALNQFADRVGVPEVRTLVVILTQSEQLGTDIATGLAEFSNNFRTNLRQRADTQANRASFMMLFPTILGLWIPAAVILVGPLAFEFWTRGQKSTELLKQRRERQNAALQPPAAPEMGPPQQ